MNKRQKKKFIKKDCYKNYHLLTGIHYFYQNDNNLLGIVVFTYHNGRPTKIRDIRVIYNIKPSYYDVIKQVTPILKDLKNKKSNRIITANNYKYTSYISRGKLPIFSDVYDIGRGTNNPITIIR